MTTNAAFRESIRIKHALLCDGDFMAAMEHAGQALVRAARRGNRVLLAGNGGSAADAQHLAAEFVGRFKADRPGLPAMSLAADPSIVTAIGNDYGFESLFARQLEAQARIGDVFIGITTSGKSPNIVKALAACRGLGVLAIALCGAGGQLEEHADIVLRVPSTDSARIQECHILIGHILCERVEAEVFVA